jgi:hypothetical protein
MWIGRDARWCPPPWAWPSATCCLPPSPISLITILRLAWRTRWTTSPVGRPGVCLPCRPSGPVSILPCRRRRTTCPPSPSTSPSQSPPARYARNVAEPCSGVTDATGPLWAAPTFPSVASPSPRPRRLPETPALNVGCSNYPQCRYIDRDASRALKKSAQEQPSSPIEVTVSES